jgi:ribosomal protein S18 acetylase RimI-like enzyme
LDLRFLPYNLLTFNMQYTSLAQLESSTLYDLASLHRIVMHTLLSELGLPVVRRYYEICQRDESVIGICAMDNGKCLGWAVGSPSPEQVNAQLRTPLSWFAGQMLTLAVTRPAALVQLAKSVLSASDANTLRPGQIELTYIGVAESARGQGLGKGLLKSFLEASRAGGYESVVLSVETDNPAAIALYTNGGFHITKTFREGRFERHRMEIKLQ